jgi:tRNA dimethylallyltransferase
MSEHLNKYLIVVVGATAVGKTDFCVRLAKDFGTEIVSADSRQMFREMSIGTAKPTPDEMKSVVHHFIDSHSIQNPYNVGNYEQEALETLTQIFKSHHTAILAGGSGLYVRVVCEGIDEMPEILLEVRKQLNEKLDLEGLEPLLKQLKDVDVAYYEQVDKANPQRIIRALEVFLSTGQPFSEFRKGNKAKRPFEIIKIGLKRNREELYERINKRMDTMLAQGLLEEVQNLYPYKNHNALQTVGYKEIFDFIEKKYDWDECVRLLKQNSRRYAKRQLTWFNKDADIQWFEASEYEKVKEYIKAKIIK